MQLKPITYRTTAQIGDNGWVAYQTFSKNGKTIRVYAFGFDRRDVDIEFQKQYSYVENIVENEFLKEFQLLLGKILNRIRSYIC